MQEKPAGVNVPVDSLPRYFQENIFLAAWSNSKLYSSINPKKAKTRKKTTTKKTTSTKKATGEKKEAKPKAKKPATKKPAAKKATKTKTAA